VSIPAAHAARQFVAERADAVRDEHGAVRDEHGAVREERGRLAGAVG